MPTRLCILQLGRFLSPALDGSSIFPRDSMGFEARAGETESLVEKLEQRRDAAIDFPEILSRRCSFATRTSNVFAVNCHLFCHRRPFRRAFRYRDS